MKFNGAWADAEFGSTLFIGFPGDKLFKNLMLPWCQQCQPLLCCVDRLRISISGAPGQRLRSDGSALPLILITGHGDIAMAVSAIKAGAIDFIEKPFEAATLLDSIEAAPPDICCRP